MEYKGYRIQAEVQTYEVWNIDETGELTDWSHNSDGIEITGYFIDNLNEGASGDYDFISSGQKDGDELRAMVDQHIKELEESK